MRIIRLALAGLCLGAMLVPAAPAQSQTAQLGLHVQPCTQGKSKEAALCGTYGVYEDRDARSGRIIELAITVLKAKHATNHAIAVIAGGPGQAARDFVAPVADGQLFTNLSTLQDSYDIVFMDDRGMGASDPLTCILAPPGDPAATYGHLFSDSLVRACRQKLAATHDLAQYTTRASVDDLDDIRAALGYPKLVLAGGSYGTYFAMIYLRRHPAQVESAVLDGVSPPHFQPLPGEPLGAQSALDDLVVKCNKDAVCLEKYPKFGAHFAELMKRFDRGPISVRLKNDASAPTVRMSKEVLVDHLRQLLYEPQTATYVPYVVERAYDGNYFPLAHLIGFEASGLDQALTMGAFLSYTCSDWIPFLDPAAVKAAAAHSFAGDLRIRAQKRACAIWSVPSMPADFNDVVRSDAPILIISGSDDPATPARYADQAVKFLPNAKIVLVKGGGHGADTPCTDALVAQFVRAQSAKGIDTTKCSASFAIPRFMTSLAGVP